MDARLHPYAEIRRDLVGDAHAHGAVQAVGTVGMGVTYQVTPNFSVGVEARVHTVNNGAAAPWPY